MIQRPPRSTRTDTLCPYTTLFRSVRSLVQLPGGWRQACALSATAIAPFSTRPCECRWWSFSSPSFFPRPRSGCRSVEHTSELQSLMRNSYAVFCLKKKKIHHHYTYCEYTLHNNYLNVDNNRY